MLPTQRKSIPLKFCKYCQTEQPETSFEVCRILKGVEYRRLRCKKCKRALRNKRRTRLSLWLKTYKMKLCCKRCGFSDHRALTFHHRGRFVKDFNVGNMVGGGWSVAALEREISKCIVLCANCHQIEHYKQTARRQLGDIKSRLD